MEPAFVCEFTPTVKMLAARTRKFRPGRSGLLLLIGIGFFVYTLRNMLLNFILYGFDPVWIGLLIFGLAYLIYGIFMPEINGYFSLRRYKKDINSGIYRVSFGDAIELWQGNICVRWDYQEIKRVARLKHSFELIKSERMMIMVDPDGFTKGTFEEFKQFLREKRPDLKIPE